MSLKVVFRTDASLLVGNGHVMRCLTLADELASNGATCSFVTRNLYGNQADAISHRGHALSLLPRNMGPPPSPPPWHASWAEVHWEQDFKETYEIIPECDFLVMDHYSFDVRWETGFLNKVNKILIIDDLADRRHTCSILLDQNHGRTEDHYDGLVPQTSVKLIGPQYALLRPEFRRMRERRDRGAPLSTGVHLLISMGGTDIHNFTLSVLKSIDCSILPKNFRISVVMGRNAPSLAMVKDFAKSMQCSIRVLIDVVDMASLMVNADFAIGAGGSTSWERCCLGLPSIVVQTAKNQEGAVNSLEKSGAIIVLKQDNMEDFKYDLNNGLSTLMTRNQRVLMSDSAFKLCDGRGASRVANHMSLEH